MKKTALVISASSDIGAELCKAWKAKGWEVYGTYRRPSPLVEELKTEGVHLLECDLLDKSALARWTVTWDILVFASGDLSPIGNFSDVLFDQWEKAIQINLLSPLRVLHHLLPYRSKNTPCVLFFAGAGTNGPAPKYSSYALSKIGLIKMNELLSAEIPDTRFVIVGPGWVKTKIHQQTLDAGKNAGNNFERTLEKLALNECTPMHDVIACCDWLVTTECEAVSGRNYSVAHDKWGTKTLETAIEGNPDMYKLRRESNAWK